MRRTILLIVGLLMVAGPVAAAQADAPQVTIVTPGGAQHTLSLEALAGSEDVIEKAYPLRAETGESSTTVTGFSIAALLGAAGVDPYGFSYLEVQRPGGGSVQLSSTQALSEPAPVVYSTGSGTGFIRPSAGTGDLNAADSFQSPAGLTIVMRKGASLQARVEATPRKVKVGEKVSFRAVVERAGSGEALTYSWYFDDGGSAAGESAIHAFAKPGSYSVVVGITAAGEDTGTSAVVRIQVGEAPGGGPDRKGGGTNKSKGAPDHGAAEGPPGPSSSSGSPPSASAPGSEATVPAVPSPSLPTASPPATAEPSPKVEQTRAKRQAEAKRERKLKAKREEGLKTEHTNRPSPKAKRASASKPKPSGDLVRGELLAGSVEEVKPPAASPKQATAARTGTPRADDGGGGGVPDAAWGLGAVVALLGIGALAEAGKFVDLLPRIRERLP
jgi:PKD repeat protein